MTDDRDTVPAPPVPNHNPIAELRAKSELERDIIEAAKIQAEARHKLNRDTDNDDLRLKYVYACRATHKAVWALQELEEYS